MYPNLYYLVNDLLGVQLSALKVVNSFGFFVAIAFLVAAFVFGVELKRKQAAGLLGYTEEQITVGEPATIAELMSNAVLGFLFGYKILGVFYQSFRVANFDPQEYIFSTDGNIVLGIIMAALMAFLRWQEKNKVKTDKPVQRTLRIWPSDRVGDITILAAVAGFAGAKVFDNLENWDRFIQDPIGNLFAASGLTFYGGLLVATAAIAYYLRKHKISFIHTADAIAPALMLAYGLGRIGCQVSGDGDWGVYNSAYKVDSNGVLSAATDADFATALQANNIYFTQHYGNAAHVPHMSWKGVSWLPDWLFAYSYPHNVNKEGVSLANCTWDDYCTQLPVPVIPTPLYEILMALTLFGVLWLLRKKIKIAGRMFAAYLFVNGVERFLIERIRVNTTYSIGGFHPTQAQLISSALIITGIVLWLYAPKLKLNQSKAS
ncbi:MAG: diacylglyceryl transferase [Bacteroidetes bacterium]|nr:MAG: diacylglyceryl transferase [Bacteroidota bacterium]TAE61188.1 MAG: diacylglyceryl transferase [Bacteroidota bacterium]TAF89608.1 MAG: diacylglyceryl transferase [Bacteroidota bacterium]